MMRRITTIPPVRYGSPAASAAMPSLRESFSQAAAMGVRDSVSRAGERKFTTPPAPPPVGPAPVPEKDNLHPSFRPEDLFPPRVTEGLGNNSTAAAIMTAAATGDGAGLRALLAQPGTLPDFVNGKGLSPVMVAAALGQAETLAILAAHPLVNLARQDAGGWTALHFAAEWKQESAIAALLKHHAPPELESAKGAIAFDLADDAGKEIFLGDRNFKNFLRRRDPHHPLLAPVPAAFATVAPAAATLPEALPETAPDDPAAGSFFVTLKGLGFSLHNTGRANVTAQLDAQLVKMELKDFGDAYHRISARGVQYSWQDVFVLAAGEGNTKAMSFLQDALCFEQRTLDRALEAAAARGRTDAAHHLMLWHANPFAPQKTPNGGNSTPFETAYKSRSFGVLEEMVLWSDHKVMAAPVEDILRRERNDTRRERDDGGLMALISLSALRLRKADFAKQNGAGLTAAFARSSASGNITDLLAIYSESQTPRLMRGKPVFSPKDGASAMVAALVFDRIEFARKLAADGFSLKDAPPSLRDKVDKKRTRRARDFAALNLTNPPAYPRIEDIGSRKETPQQVAAVVRGRRGTMIFE